MEAETKQKTDLKFDFLFWLHLPIAAFVYVSPFVLDWKIVGALAVLHFLQFFVVGNCVLTVRQFKVKGTQESFTYEVVTQLLGFDFDKKRFQFVVFYIVPFVVVAVAVLWQEVLKKAVLVNIF